MCSRAMTNQKRRICSWVLKARLRRGAERGAPGPNIGDKMLVMGLEITSTFRPTQIFSIQSWWLWASRIVCMLIGTSVACWDCSSKAGWLACGGNLRKLNVTRPGVLIVLKYRMCTPLQNHKINFVDQCRFLRQALQPQLLDAVATS